MTSSTRISLVGFLLTVSFTGLANATVISIENPEAFGLPGSVTGWGFIVSAGPGIYPLFTGSEFSPDPNPAGVYTDYLASSFIYGLGGDTITDSFDPLAMSGAGEFDINPSALTGTSIQGTLTIFWDEYSVSPGDPNFDPFADLLSSGDSAALPVSLTVGDQPVPVATPEPGSVWLLAIGAGIACLAGKSRRKIRALRGGTVLGAAVLCGTFAAHAQVPIVDPNDVYPLNILRFPLGPDGNNSCHPYNDPTKVGGCCGSPGALGCAGPAILMPFPGGSCTTAPSGNSSRVDSYDGITYCNLPQTSCDPLVNDSLYGSSSTSASAAQNLTFYFTSDIHFDRGGYPLEGQVNHVHYLNTLANQQVQWTFQHDFIGPPLGVVIAGDIGTDGTAPNLGGYRTLFERGTISPGSLNYPVFFGLGNHETVTEVDPSAAHRMWDYLQHRMGGCSVNFDTASGNYSWDWGRMHMVMLNTWAADTTNLWNGASGANGLVWLANDLQSHVGQSGRPVAIFQHYEFNGSFYGPLNSNITIYPATVTVGQQFCLQNQDQCDSIPNGGCGAGWTFKNATAFLNTVSPYNVVGIFAGHTHLPSIDAIETTSWASGIPYVLSPGEKGYCNAGVPNGSYGPNTYNNSLGVPLDVFTNGTGSQGNTGDFFAVRYSEGAAPGNGAVAGMPPTLEVELFHWTTGGLTKGAPVLNPVLAASDPEDKLSMSDFYGGLHACRKAIDTTFYDLTPQVSLSVGYNPHPGAVLPSGTPSLPPEYGVVITNPNGLLLPPSLAIRVRFPGDKATLNNPSFMDRCAAGKSPTGAYIPFNASQLGQPISLPVTLNPNGNQDPDLLKDSDVSVDLVAMSPLGEIAGPVSVSASVTSNSSSTVQQSFTIWGPPNTPFQLNTGVIPITVGGTTIAQNWFSGISATQCPSSIGGTWCFDANGVATVTVSISSANFFNQATGSASMNITVLGQSSIPFNLSIPLVVKAPVGSTPAGQTVSVGSASPALLPVTFTLNGPPGTPFTITWNYKTLYNSTIGGPPLPQSWADRVATNSPGLAFCQQGHVLCFGASGQTTMTTQIDTAQVLGLFTPQATVTFSVNSIETDPKSPAYFVIPLTLVVNTNAAPRIDVTLPPQPFTPGSYGLITATLVEPNSIDPLYYPPPAGQMALVEDTLDSTGHRTSTAGLAAGNIDTFCHVDPNGTTDVAPNWPFYTVVFGGSYPARNDYCPAASVTGGGNFLLSSLSVGLHHLQFGFNPSNEDYASVSSPIVDFLVQPAPAAISALAGSGQSAVDGSSYAQPLQAKVTASNGTPLLGIPVQFTAPATQPTATFGGQATASAVTDANGIATSPVITSSLTAGTFVVNASAAGVPAPAAFTLTNAPTPSNPLLTATITAKAGGLNSRTWTLNVTDSQGPATGVSLSSISFTQVAGAACTPVVNTLLPIALGNLATGAASSAPVTIDFSTCASSARFTVQVSVQANGGAYVKTTTIGNQFP